MLNKPCISSLFPISFNKFNKTRALILDALYNLHKSQRKPIIWSILFIFKDSLNLLTQNWLYVNKMRHNGRKRQITALEYGFQVAPILQSKWAMLYM